MRLASETARLPLVCERGSPRVYSRAKGLCDETSKAASEGGQKEVGDKSNASRRPYAYGVLVSSSRSVRSSSNL